MLDPSHRLAWLKLNAYGVVLAGLALLGFMDLIKPGGAQLARLTGQVPPGQWIWVSAFVIAGGLMMYGFLCRDRIAETAGLILLNVGLLAQSVVAYDLLGWTDFTTIRVALIGVFGWCLWARVSVLWSKDGFTFTIPPRDGPHHPTRRR